ncbi:uncharacterized protein LOC122060781 [Macadamia integrifolia]|uniref:uncharacterized protein LOC122060781 n=1 Tax=Macadamia integrifolia TaxID=60698 RepID=UPI001C52CF3A|nr:uncharacterized protein LOC122060781 [Macadamia integrifolia]
MCMFFLRLLSIVLLLQFTLAQSGSLSLKLIHRDSVESPLYPGKLSSEERTSRYVNRTIAHARRMIQIARGTRPDEISIPVDYHGFDFIVAKVASVKDPHYLGIPDQLLIILFDVILSLSTPYVHPVNAGKIQVYAHTEYGSTPQSFISQLGDRFQHRFSYCLQPMYGPAAGLYYLDFLALSIADQRISNPPLTLWQTLIDSGSPYTLFPPGPFASMKSYLLHYLQPYNVKRIPPRDLMDLCFDRTNGFNNFPSITFHFRNADLVLWPENSFLIKDDYFCLAIAPINELQEILIGAYQQANFRFLYDLHGRTLSFSPEDCSKDSN